jgi:hypothetical protein
MVVTRRARSSFIEVSVQQVQEGTRTICRRFFTIQYAARKRASVEEMGAALQDRSRKPRALQCGKADDVADCPLLIARHGGFTTFAIRTCLSCVRAS